MYTTNEQHADTAVPAHVCWPDHWQPGDLPSFVVRCPSCTRYHTHSYPSDDDDDGRRQPDCGGELYRVAFGCDVPRLTETQARDHNERVDRAEDMLRTAAEVEAKARVDALFIDAADGWIADRFNELQRVHPGMSPDDMAEILIQITQPEFNEVHSDE